MGKDIFEYEGIRYKIDYGLYAIDKDNDSIAWNYGDYIALQHKDKKWFHFEGGSYQGEWVSLGIGDDGFYFHKSTYGSCSGCDWLLGIGNKEGAIEFLKEMKKIIKIGENWEQAKIYLLKEKENGWDDLKEAINEVIKEYEKSIIKQ